MSLKYDQFFGHLSSVMKLVFFCVLQVIPYTIVETSG